MKGTGSRKEEKGRGEVGGDRLDVCRVKTAHGKCVQTPLSNNDIGPYTERHGGKG
jgi:hypothetical protein